jgi:DNA-binding transcriptional LysR family regulator
MNIGLAMDLRHLRYFLAVADEGHFGRAAQKLHIVQPALSMQIRSLEEELGGPLFIRTSRRVELTEAGRLLQIEAQRTIVQAEHAKSSVQKSMRGEVGSVRVGFAGNAAFTGKLMDDLRTFHGAYPDVKLELRELAPLLQRDEMLAGRLDVGYCPAFEFDFDPSLVAEQVGTWPWVVAMADDHPLARRKHLTAKSLITESFILYAADGNDEGQLTVLKHLLGCEPRVVHRVASTLSVLALAAAGLGISLVPASLSHVAVPKVVYRAIADSGLTSNLVLISRAQETAGAVRAFLNLSLGER